MPLLPLTSSLKEGWQKPWLRKRSVTFRFIASVRWIPSQLINLLGSLHLTVPGEPHGECRLKFNGPPTAPQQGLKASSNCFFWRIWLCNITAALTAAAHPIWSRAAFSGHNEICNGRHPSGGKPWTTMYFAPLCTVAYTCNTVYLALLWCQIHVILNSLFGQTSRKLQVFNLIIKEEGLLWNIKVFGQDSVKISVTSSRKLFFCCKGKNQEKYFFVRLEAKF